MKRHEPSREKISKRFDIPTAATSGFDMGSLSTPSGERLHIGFFGCRNAGKSSLVNAVTSQALSVVSETPGTTTDPVQKAMELLPIGPVVILDTPGLDDSGALGDLRVEKTRQALSKTELAVLVIDAARGESELDRETVRLFEERELPYLTVFNKADLLPEVPDDTENALYVSTETGRGIERLKERLGKFAGKKPEKTILGDLVASGDTVVLVVPIDESAPKGRLILPQQQVLREVLDRHATALVCQDSELAETLSKLKELPRLVITDSQAFKQVAAVVPEAVPLTSFSILFARYKGNLEALVAGAERLKTLTESDRVLISEGCTHHRQCNDIGTVKLPKLIEKYAGVRPKLSFTSGGEFPEDLSDYDLVIHCGGCMLNEREMKSRLARANASSTPIVNYGVAIAEMTGILGRSLAGLQSN